MYRGQFFTGYRVPNIKTVFAKSEYLLLLLLCEANGVVDCLSKHAQHKSNNCRWKRTAYSDQRETVNIRKY